MASRTGGRAESAAATGADVDATKAVDAPVAPAGPDSGRSGAAAQTAARVHGSAPLGDPENPGRLSAFRRRVLPRSVLGVASLILAFAVGAGFSGVVLFSYYQYKLNQTNQRVNGLITGYKDQFTKAEADLNSAVAAAKANIAAQLKAVQEQQASPAVLAALVKQVSPSVLFVHTLDANGQSSVGTAFVVASNSSQTLLITSYTAVAAATHSPGPPVYVRRGGNDTPVTVKSWDPQYDLALLVLPKGNLPVLTRAPTNPSPEPGDRLFAISGLGSAGASVSQGTVVDVSASGLAVDAGIGTAFQGGPLVTQSGQVVAVASRSYAPLGFTTDGVWYAPYVGAACNKVLNCPGGNLSGSR